MNQTLTDDAGELIDLARFRRLDARNGSEEAKDRLLGLLADELEALRKKYRTAVWSLRDIKALAGTTKRKQAGCEIAAHALAQLREPLIAEDEEACDG